MSTVVPQKLIFRNKVYITSILGGHYVYKVLLRTSSTIQEQLAYELVCDAVLF
jgi:hypothetical protein